MLLLPERATYLIANYLNDNSTIDLYLALHFNIALKHNWKYLSIRMIHIILQIKGYDINHNEETIKQCIKGCSNIDKTQKHFLRIITQRMFDDFMINNNIDMFVTILITDINQMLIHTPNHKIYPSYIWTFIINNYTLLDIINNKAYYLPDILLYKAIIEENLGFIQWLYARDIKYMFIHMEKYIDGKAIELINYKPTKYYEYYNLCLCLNDLMKRHNRNGYCNKCRSLCWYFKEDVSTKPIDNCVININDVNEVNEILRLFNVKLYDGYYYN